MAEFETHRLCVWPSNLCESHRTKLERSRNVQQLCITRSWFRKWLFTDKFEYRKSKFWMSLGRWNPEKAVQWLSGCKGKDAIWSTSTTVLDEFSENGGTFINFLETHQNLWEVDWHRSFVTTLDFHELREIKCSRWHLSKIRWGQVDALVSLPMLMPLKGGR